MKKALFFGIVALAALAGLLYGTPYFAMNQLRAAGMTQDSDALAAHVDSERLRANLGR